MRHRPIGRQAQSQTVTVEGRKEGRVTRSAVGVLKDTGHVIGHL